MTKNYLQLNKYEVEKLLKYINRNKINKMSFEDMEKQNRAEEFDFGKGVIVIIDKENIIGTAAVVLKECKEKGIAYVIKVDINENSKDKKYAVCEIIKESKDLAKKYGAKQLFLGTKDEANIETLKNLGMEKQYSVIRMKLDDRNVRYKPLGLIELSEQNKNEYLRIYNNSFREVPNGATLTEKEVEEYVKNDDENNCYYIVTINNEKVGFLQFKIENCTGEFDLGLIKEVRGKGYGKLLLETALSFLNEKKVNEINLTVVTKNIVALNMYKKRGFIESELISQWFQVPITELLEDRINV